MVVPPSAQQAQASPPMAPHLCGFCRNLNCPSCSTRFCPVGLDYVHAHKVIQVDGWYRWPDNSRIDTHPQGIKFVVDKTLEDRAREVSRNMEMAPHTLFFEVNPEPSPVSVPAAAYIEEVAPEDVVMRTYHAYHAPHDESPQPTTLSEMLAPPTQPAQKAHPAPAQKQASKANGDKPHAGQFQYRAKVESPDVAQQLYEHAMGATLSITPGELLAVSPDLRCLFVDSIRARSTAYLCILLPRNLSAHRLMDTLMAQTAPMYTAPIMALNVKIARKHDEVGLYDTGAELVCISAATAKELRLPFNPDLKLCMRDANGGTKTTFGVVENLDIHINGLRYWFMLGSLKTLLTDSFWADLLSW